VAVVPFILLGIVLLYLTVERVFLLRWRKVLATRIHVNGTRGKSSVVRYIAAGLRASGKRPLAKITGVRPTIIHPSSQKEIIQRKGPANVREQFRMLHAAYRAGCDAIVLECMSIMPALQNIETEILQPQITVLTNILDDHREELGKSDEERVEAYCSSIPTNGIVVTNEIKHLEEIQNAGRQKNTRIVVPSKETKGLAHTVPQEIIAENVALALTVCEILGMDARLALIAILAEASETKPFHKVLSIGEHAVHFVDGFAVNDVPSAMSFLNLWKKKLGGWNKLYFVLNTRTDRPLRSLEFAKWCSSLEELSGIILIGRHVPFMKRELIELGFPTEKIVFWSAKELHSPLGLFRGIITEPSVVFGFANIAGDGLLLLEELEKSLTNDTTSSW
jgi:gamma-polyglutamate synthase